MLGMGCWKNQEKYLPPSGKIPHQMGAVIKDRKGSWYYKQEGGGAVGSHQESYDAPQSWGQIQGMGSHWTILEVSQSGKFYWCLIELG